MSASEDGNETQSKGGESAIHFSLSKSSSKDGNGTQNKGVPIGSLDISCSESAIHLTLSRSASKDGNRTRCKGVQTGDISCSSESVSEDGNGTQNKGVPIGSLDISCSESAIHLTLSRSASKDGNRTRSKGVQTGDISCSSESPDIVNQSFSESASKDGYRTQSKGVQVGSLGISCSETREAYLKHGVRIYHAALKGEWESVKETFEEFPNAVRDTLTERKETALHIAAAAAKFPNKLFVTKLVSLMDAEDLALENEDKHTALWFAAASGSVDLAKVMVRKNNKLPTIRHSDNRMLPLYVAALLGHKEMVDYLYHVTGETELTPHDRIELLVCMINTDHYDLPLEMLGKYPELATARAENYETALHALAQRQLNHSTFDSQSQPRVWGRCTKFFSGINVVIDNTSMRRRKALQLVKCIWEKILLLDNSKISDLIEKPRDVLFVASELGNVDFIVTLICSYPDLIWKVDERKRSIFHIAILNRQENVFNLIYEIGAIKDLIAAYHDEDDNNMLHLAGMLAPPNRRNIVLGAALQMQRELLWFKEVEKVVQPLFLDVKNSTGKTPQALFTENHKELRAEGEKWMKETATQCMVVATLIATMMFAAAFTLPGGNTDTGIPIYRKTLPFMFFAISDAIALLCSSTSILTFLSIITSRYAEKDFLVSLPIKLIIGLTMLVISVAAMMVAFCSTFFIVFYKGVKWIPLPIALIACMPVFWFGYLQYRLFCDVILSTYSSRSLFKPSKRIRFQGN